MCSYSYKYCSWAAVRGAAICSPCSTTWWQYRKIVLCTFVAGYEKPAVNNNNNNNNEISSAHPQFRIDGRKRWYFLNCIAIWRRASWMKWKQLIRMNKLVASHGTHSEQQQRPHFRLLLKCERIMKSRKCLDAPAGALFWSRLSPFFCDKFQDSIKNVIQRVLFTSPKYSRWHSIVGYADAWLQLHSVCFIH